MAKPVLFGLFMMFLLIAIPAADAMLAPGKGQMGVATKTIPFKYLDKNTGETYIVSLLNITIKNNWPVATLRFEWYDKNGNLKGVFPPWQGMIGSVNRFNGAAGPVFVVKKIQPARCITRTNKCSEDAVMLSVT